MFARQPAYLKTVRRQRVPDARRTTSTSRRQFDRGPRGCSTGHRQTTVPCNNDLLAGNFIEDGDRMWLIDYEYSGNNDPCFELGNIWSECRLSLDQLEELVTGYYGRPLRHKTRPGPAAGHRVASTAGRCGDASRMVPAHSTSTSGTGRWSATRMRSPSSGAPTSTGCSTTSPRPTEIPTRGNHDCRVQAKPFPTAPGSSSSAAASIGTSVAYHLTKLGVTDVVLLEQGQLSSGTTWHAAGLVGQLRASESGTRLVQYSTALYAELEAETGLSAGYKQCGGRHGRAHRGPDGAAAPHRGHRRGLRPGLRAAHSRAGPGALSGDAGRRPGRRHLAARRRQGQPDRPDLGAGQGRAAAGRRIVEQTRVLDVARPDGRCTGCAPTPATSRPRSS